MNYPFWDTTLGYGVLMAVIAVVHVFVSHFAIGGGLYLVVAERAARRRGDDDHLGFLRRLSRFFVLTTVVFGALTGVGIWFIIGLLNPAATAVLIRNFVWGWAAEWCFFIIEILAALLYYYGWDCLTPRRHLIIGWIYFGAAWLSLVIINGIVTFMLTPGDWLATGRFWDGFFNPTYWSSLVLRTGICIMLAGLCALAVAARLPAPGARVRLVRYNAVWGLVGLAVVIPSLFWYVGDIPADLMAAARQTMNIPFAALDLLYLLTAAIAALLAILGLLAPRAWRTEVAAVALALGLVWFGSYEWFREALRKPYVITGYMYASGVEGARAADYRADGMLAHMAYRTGDEGADLFRRACRSCHSLENYNALKPFFDGADEEFITAMVQGIGAMRGNMPPWTGTPEEARLLAAHLAARTDRRPFAEVCGLSGVDLGRRVYEVRCGSCHVLGGFNDKTQSLAGLSEEEYRTLLDMSDDLGEEMPPFTGGEPERVALIQFLQTLSAPAGTPAAATRGGAR
ncbi:MAG TPA: cytochrome ubiquinol oxidase subunit I [candidate division Zixibacteria bacterium]|nr:cytochrome ubiquinol oxidase subunit I [candidate division Zixibacteria bacterium]